MLNIKHLKSGSKLLLLSFSITLLNQFYSPTEPALAYSDTIENMVQLAQLKEGGSETYYAKVDMDDEGNFALVYKARYFDIDQYCNELKIKKFNKYGQPIGLISNIGVSCDASPDDYIPDIAMRPDGQMIVTWLEMPASGFPATINVAQYDNNYVQINSLVETVSDENIYDIMGVPKIAVNKVNGNNYAIVWSTCESEFDCSSHHLMGQTYQFDETLGPVRASPNNFQINLPNGSNNIKPDVSFSNDRIMAVWEEDNFVNVTVKARTFSAGLSPDLETNELDFKYLNNAYEPSVAGVNRPHTGTSPLIGNTFYTSWTEAGVDQNDIFTRKISCDAATNDCSLSVRGINQNPLDTVAQISRVNSTTAGNQGHSVISTFTNQNNTTKVFGEDSSAYDYFAVAWMDIDEPANKPMYSQVFKNSLAKLGQEKDYSQYYNNSQYGELDMAMNRDGLRVTSLLPDSPFNNEHYAILERSEFLKYGNETLVHAADPWPQADPKVAMNSNGNYVVTYDSWNGDDFDIIYALYDNNGNAIKNLSIANETIASHQLYPSVSFFNESSSSANFGKFIISWDGNGAMDGGGVYYRIFNADGTPDGGEVYVEGTSTGNYQHSSSVSAGGFGQFLIAFEENIGFQNDIRYFYYNNGTTISGQVNTNLSNDYTFPKALLNPQANNNSISDSQFIITWANPFSNQIFKSEGFLNTPTTIVIQNENLFIQRYSPDLSGAYIPALSTLTPSLNPFIYGVSYIPDNTGQPSIDIFTFGAPTTPLQTIDLGPHNDYIFSDQTTLSMDKFTGNILAAWKNEEDFSWLTSNRFLYYDIKNGLAYEEGSRIDGQTSGAHAIVQASNQDYSQIDVPIGVFDINEGVLLNTLVYFFGNSAYIPTISIANFFTIGSQILGTVTGSTGTIDSNSGFGSLTFTYDAGPPPTFDSFEEVRLLNAPNNYTFSPLVDITGQFLKLEIDTGNNTAEYTKFGPLTSINTYPRYGEYVYQPSLAYYTTGGNEIDNAVAVYSTDAGTYEDSNGVYQQLLTDPFNYGTVENSNPAVSQTISQGGKYIIVPSTIDFGTLARGSDGTVNFSDLSPNYLQVTDLDGTDFDLTVSMTDLANTIDPLQTIDKSNLSIKNNDGINGLATSNPGVTTSSTFTDLADISLDSSTNSFADLSTNKTLIRKNNNNTGIWEIYPSLKLNIPLLIDSGTYSGTITFTLI